jgi:high affinity Mn2+ porin
VLALLAGDAVGNAVLGADLPVKAPSTAPDPFDWSGFYVGAHAGVASAHSTWSATQPGASNLAGSLDLFQAYDPFDGSGSHFGGLSAGYNYMLPSRIVVGAETDVSFASTLSAIDGFASPVIGSATYSDTVELFGTARGRLGYDVNRWLYYVTGGLAWTYDQFNRSQTSPGTSGGPPKRSSMGGSDGQSVLAWRPRSPPVGASRPSIFMLNSVTAPSIFRSAGKTSRPIFRCTSSGSA